MAMGGMSALLPAVPVSAESQVLWYDSPAGSWKSEALPIGTGRLGARPNP